MKSAQSAINVTEFNIKKFEMYDINETVCLTTMMEMRTEYNELQSSKVSSRRRLIRGVIENNSF